MNSPFTLPPLPSYGQVMTDQQRPHDSMALSVPEAARALGVGLSTTKMLVSTGEIRHFRVGRRVLVPREELSAFIARQTDRALAGGMK